MRNDFLECGKIVSSHGVKGEAKLLPWTDDPAYLLHFSTLYLEGGKKPLKILSSRLHKNMVLLTIEGVTSIDDVAPLRGKVLSIHRKDDPDDRPFLQDFQGLEVVDADTGESYGRVKEVLVTGANDVYDVRDANGVQRLVPDIPSVVLEVDFAAGKITIRPLEGLFDA